MQKIIFIPDHRSPLPNKIGSSLMRACVISAYMQQKWGHLIDVRYSRELPYDAAEGDIVIFVKDYRHKDIALSKNKKCITVYDPIDIPTAFDNNEKFDIMIACSEAYADIMAKKHKINRNKIICIDVLHTNINRIKVPHRTDNKKIFVGAVNPGSTALLTVEEFEDFLKFSENNNFTLKNIDTDKKNFDIDPFFGVKELFECYQDIDIGLVLYEQNKLNYDRMNQKPSTKISAYASYDIPVICSYQRALDPIIKEYPEFSNFIVENIEEAKSLILKLIKNVEYYKSSKNLFHNIGEMFHMDHAYEKYVNQINEAYYVL